MASRPKIDIDPALHLELKKYCKGLNVQMKLFVADLIRDGMKNKARSKRRWVVKVKSPAVKKSVEAWEGPPFWAKGEGDKQD